MDVLPVCLDLKGRRALVVGGDVAAAAKVDLLRRAHARVTVLATTTCAALPASARRGEIVLRSRAFTVADLDDVAIVVVSGADLPVARRVATAARTARIPVNVVDRPELSTFTFPAIVDRDPVVVAIATGGTSPTLARQLRNRIEALLPDGLGRLSGFLGERRGQVHDRLSDTAARRHFWDAIVDGPVAAAVLAGDEAGAAAQFARALDASGAPPRGEVWLVGAGPGEPDLLTLRALRLIQCADVALHDSLVAPGILSLLRRDAERIDVSKRRGRTAMTQDEIGGLMVRLAGAGRRVLRLTGSDPLALGRDGEEEVAKLARHGIPIQIVPGITAATGSAAGIPPAHRDRAQA